MSDSEIGTATVSFRHTIFRYAVFGAGCCTRRGDEMGLIDGMNGDVTLSRMEFVLPCESQLDQNRHPKVRSQDLVCLKRSFLQLTRNDT